ncbi:hypothetical protein LSTR_LSTR008662 [Laodelphax striatellus]|uniref:Peroxisomal membrane protein 11C n=1 Tax=Laodelphax striatellus TaxID=195883 RepID=A0A482X4R0_LAOST|nr:hypothetical protein LSTR_LSTR008662 [Laodelphax striatellus]
MNTISSLLESCSGRDQILRLIYYGTLCVSDTKFCHRFLGSKLTVFCNQISECRTFLRLFDDIPMLNYTLSYGLGDEEEDILMSLCGVAVNICDQLYYPFEHVAWAADKRLLSIKSDRWWTISTICWAFSVYFSFCKCLRYFSILERRKENKRLSDENDRLELKEIAKLQFNELLTMAQCLANLVHAIHWLPSGVLWAGRLKEWQIGILGTFATVLSLYQTIFKI